MASSSQSVNICKRLPEGNLVSNSNGLWMFMDVYPLVNVYIAMENHQFSWENPLFLWWFSIAMLNYQRIWYIRSSRASSINFWRHHTDPSLVVVSSAAPLIAAISPLESPLKAYKTTMYPKSIPIWFCHRPGGLPQFMIFMAMFIWNHSIRVESGEVRLQETPGFPYGNRQGTRRDARVLRRHGPSCAKGAICLSRSSSFWEIWESPSSPGICGWLCSPDLHSHFDTANG